jgi:hypothetical protein
MHSGIRFDPPLVTANPDRCWLLRRAFGPPDAVVVVAGSGPTRILELAKVYDLAARVGARVPSKTLEAEVGAEVARGFRDASAKTAALGLLVERICCEIGATSQGLGVPVIFVKGAALLLDGRVTPGSRNMGDVDVLVPTDGAADLQRALIAGGCTEIEAPTGEHQLRFLAHPLGLGIEIHHKLPGVHRDGTASVTADALIAEGLCRPAESLANGLWVPRGSILLAHVLAHGFAQHGLGPDTYPFSRVLADAQDLVRDDRSWDAFLESDFGWVAEDVSRVEAEALRELVRRLERGDDPAPILTAEGPDGLLLRHLVAGVEDPGYGRAMRLRRHRARLTDRPRWWSLAIDAWRTVWLTRAQVDILYGRPRTAVAYWGWRLWRPFDLALRAAQYGLERVRHLRRRRT